MLRPSNEALNLIKTFLEVASNLCLEFCLVWFQFNPEVVNIWQSLFVQLYNFDITTIFFFCIIVILFVWLQFQVGKQIKLILSALTSWWKNEVIDWLLANFFNWNLF
jgi:hypothetical protein